MNMLRNIKSLIAAILLVAGTSSCLDKLPESSIREDEAMQTFDDAEQILTGIYEGLMSSSLFSGTLTVMPDIQADLAYTVENFSNVYGPAWLWNLLSTDQDVESVYAALYGVISRCNFFLERVDAVKQQETNYENIDALDTYTGEVYTIRALCYSKLIECFCKAYDPATAENELGVVLRSKYSTPEPMKRASLKASYQFVIDDLNRAEELRTTTTTSTTTSTPRPLPHRPSMPAWPSTCRTIRRPSTTPRRSSATTCSSWPTPTSSTHPRIPI